MHKKIKRSVRSEAEDRLTPFEVAVLSRVVRADIIAEADLVFAWGMGPWAAPALDGLLKRELVSRRETSINSSVRRGSRANRVHGSFRPKLGP